MIYLICSLAELTLKMLNDTNFFFKAQVNSHVSSFPFLLLCIDIKNAHNIEQKQRETPFKTLVMIKMVCTLHAKLMFCKKNCSIYFRHNCIFYVNFSIFLVFFCVYLKCDSRKGDCFIFNY